MVVHAVSPWQASHKQRPTCARQAAATPNTHNGQRAQVSRGYYLGGRQQRRPHVRIQHHKLHLHILRPAAHEHVWVMLDALMASVIGLAGRLMYDA